MSTPNEITKKENRSAKDLDDLEQLYVKKILNKLPENFEAIILSGEPEQHNSAEELKAFGTEFQEKNDNRYFFVRVMPVKSQGAILPDPFRAKDDKVAKRLINMYPLAYIEVGRSRKPPTHGDVYQCRYTNNDRRGIALVKRLRNSNEKIGRISNRESHKAFRGLMAPGLLGAGTFIPTGNYESPDTSHYEGGSLSNSDNLTPSKATYNGRYLPKGTVVYNGYPTHGKTILQIPDPRYFKQTPSTTGLGALLKDHIFKFNQMCEHFYNDFGRKLRASCQRTFKTQMDLRRAGVANGKCTSMKSKSGGTCKTARPGSSNHGWGMAFDVKNKNGRMLRFSSEEYHWLVKNAATYGFYHPSWAHEDGSLPEPWHWEVDPKVRIIKKK